MIISVDIHKLNFQKSWDYLGMVPKVKEMMTSAFGVEILGIFMTEGGGVGEVIYILKWGELQFCLVLSLLPSIF